MPIIRIPAPLVFCLAMACVASTASGQEGFSFSDLNPFRSREAVPSDPVPQAETPKPFRFPTLPAPSLPKPTLPTLSLPKLELPKFTRAPRSEGSSTWTKLNRGTKQFFSRTKSTLMPWSTNNATRSSRSGVRVAREPAKPSFMAKLFGPSKEEPKIDSVNKYLALPRPSP